MAWLKRALVAWLLPEIEARKRDANWAKLCRMYPGMDPTPGADGIDRMKEQAAANGALAVTVANRWDRGVPRCQEF